MFCYQFLKGSLCFKYVVSPFIWNHHLGTRRQILGVNLNFYADNPKKFVPFEVCAESSPSRT